MHIKLIQYGLIAWQASLTTNEAQTPIWEGQGYETPEQALREAKSAIDYIALTEDKPQ